MTAFIFFYEFVLRFFDVFFIMLCLKPKYKKIPTFLILFVPMLILWLLYAKNGFDGILYPFISYGVLLISCIVLFKNKWYAKLVMPIVELFLSATVNFFYIILLGSFGLSDSFEDNKTGLMICTLIYLLIMGLLVAIWNKKLGKLEISFRYTNTFLLLPISQIVIYYAFQTFLDPLLWGNGAMASNENNMKNSVIMLNIAMILSVVADVLVFLTYNKVSSNEKMEKELQERDYRDRINMEYYKSLEENAVQMRKMRHDFANAIEIANCMAESENSDAKESARKMLGSMEEELENIHMERYCRNELVNALISSKAKECREKGIEAEFRIIIPEKIDIEEYDLCRALTNIIDNSMNAVMNCDDERAIHIELLYADNTFTVSSVNKSTPHIEKHDGREHGYGLKILNDIAKKYNGSFNFTDDKKTFKATLIIKAQEQD